MPAGPSSPSALTVRDKLLEDAYSFLYPQALYALIKLEILSCLSEGPRTAEDLARTLGLQIGPLELLLSAAGSAGYLRKSGSGAFEILPMLRTRGGLVDLAPLVESAVEGCYTAAAGIVDFVRTGVPVIHLQSLRNESAAWSATLTRGSNAVSVPIADALAGVLTDGVRRVLDLGAGAAPITRRLLKRNRSARAVLIDSAQVLEFTARTYLDPEGLLSRCTLEPGDFTSSTPLPREQDLVVMSNVIHVLDPDENLRVLERGAAGALSLTGAWWLSHSSPRAKAHGSTPISLCSARPSPAGRAGTASPKWSGCCERPASVSRLKKPSAPLPRRLLPGRTLGESMPDLSDALSKLSAAPLSRSKMPSSRSPAGSTRHCASSSSAGSTGPGGSGWSRSTSARAHRRSARRSTAPSSSGSVRPR